MHGQILFTLDMYNVNWHGKHHTRDTKKKTHNVKHINIYLYICIIGHIGEKQEWYIYIYIIQTLITEKSINFHVKLNFNNKRWNIGNMEWGYVFDLVNITGWTPLVLAGPPPCPGQGSGVPHYPGGVSDAGGNPSLACLWNSLRPSCHPPTTERQWTLNKPVLLYEWPF